MGAPTQAWRGAVEDRGTEKKDRHPRPCLAPKYPEWGLHKASAHQARPQRAPRGGQHFGGLPRHRAGRHCNGGLRRLDEGPLALLLSVVGWGPGPARLATLFPV